MEQFRSAYTLNDFMTGDVAVTTSGFHKIGEMKVEAGELRSLGYGNNESQEGSAGRLYMDLRDN
jgi:hypothetical protein